MISDTLRSKVVGVAIGTAFVLIIASIAMFGPVKAQQGVFPKKDLVQVYNGTFTSSPASTPKTVGDATTIIAYLTVTAASGTSPTLNVKFQDSSDNGTTWWDIAGTTFTQATGATSQLVVATRGFAREIQPVVTIGGTSPSFTFHLEMLTY